MKLMTKELEKRFAEVASQDGKGYDAIVIAKYFHPAGSWTWYATEYDPKEKMFFGYVKGFEDEFGYFSLAEMESIKGPLGLGIERDLYFKERTLKEVLNAVGK